MGMVANQYDIYLVTLDPTQGHEIQKTRPCLVISPNEMNHVISTVIIAPMTTKSHPYPTRISTTLKGKKGWIVLDQIRTIDRLRLIKYLGTLDKESIRKVKNVIHEMLLE
jgi:mRNA interferase MazF